jgi:hypothetical protein
VLNDHLRVWVFIPDTGKEHLLVQGTDHHIGLRRPEPLGDRIDGLPKHLGDVDVDSGDLAVRVGGLAKAGDSPGDSLSPGRTTTQEVTAK